MTKSMILVAVMVCLMAAIPGTARAAGDAEKGAAIYKKKCVFCHATEASANKMGPSMAGIYGRKAGTTDYDRYKGLKGADFSWDDEALDAFLKNPKEFLGHSTSMATVLNSADDRAHVISYLKTLK